MTADMGLSVYLAPLAGITDTAMRQICLEYGDCLTFTEMISVNGLFYNNSRTKDLLHIAKSEKTVGVQLFGSSADTVSRMAASTEDMLGKRLREININMGCPAPKIVRNGEGAALLKDPRRAADIIRKTVMRVSVPVTVKFRKGFLDGEDISVDFAKMCEDSGAERIYVHGRTREQYYSGKADRGCIKRVKESVGIPVIGNGDIFAAEDVLEMAEETGCDGVMVARGALGNPFIFRDIRELIENGAVTAAPSPGERADAFLRQLELCIEEKGERLAVRQMRKHAAYYIKGASGSAALRKRAVEAEKKEDFEAVFREFREAF